MERNRNLKEEWITDFTHRYLQGHSCERAEDVLAHLLRNGMGNDTRIRQYLLLADYQTMLQANGSVMDTIYQLSDKYSISERQVQNIIYDWRRSKSSNKRKAKGEK